MMSAFLPSPTSNRFFKNFIFLYLPEIWRCGGVPIKNYLQKATPYLGESIEQESFKNIFFFSQPIINKKQIVIKFPQLPILVYSRCFIPLFQNHYHLILLSPLFQPPDLNQPNGEQTVSITNPTIQEDTLQNTPFHISIFRMSLSLSKNFEFSHKAIYPTMGGKNFQIYGVHEVPRRWKSPRMFIINPSLKETTHSSGSVFSKIYFPPAKMGKGKKPWLIPWLKPKKNTYLILSISV